MLYYSQQILFIFYVENTWVIISTENEKKKGIMTRP
jgi:hypothetical protein